MSSAKKQSSKQVTKLMSATLKCSQQSAAYGNCIVKNYQNISKDACLQEFLSYKECVQKNLGRKF